MNMRKSTLTMNVQINSGNVVKYNYDPNKGMTVYQLVDVNATKIEDKDLETIIFMASYPYSNIADLRYRIDGEMLQIEKIEELNAKELKILYKKNYDETLEYTCANTPTNRTFFNDLNDRQNRIIEHNKVKKSLKTKNKLLALFVAATILLAAYIAAPYIKRKIESSSKAKNEPSISTQMPTDVPTSAPTNEPTKLTIAIPTESVTVEPTQKPINTSTPTATPTQKPTNTPETVIVFAQEETKIQVSTSVPAKSNFNEFRDSYYKITSKEDSRNVTDDDLTIAYEIFNSRYGITRNSMNEDKEINVSQLISEYTFDAMNQENDKYMLSNFIEDESISQELKHDEDALRRAMKGEGDPKVFGEIVNRLAKQGFYNAEDFDNCVNGLRNLDMNTFQSDEEYENYLKLVFKDDFFTVNNFLQVMTLKASITNPTIFNSNQDTMGAFTTLINKSSQLLSEILLMTPQEREKIR